MLEMNTTLLAVRTSRMIVNIIRNEKYQKGNAVNVEK